jgi:ATP-dependent Clp protease ATP-binding subunit ClpC
LLQVLEDGRLTDNKGRVIDFSNVMLILTSNVGSRKILQMAGRDEGGSAEQKYDRVRTAVKAELGSKFRPEFLNRLDEVIVFEALDTDQVSSVADIMLKELVARCADNEVTLTCTKALTAAVVGQGYSATYGARPLRRAVQRLCEDAVAEAMLSGFVSSGEKLELDAGDKDGQIKLKNGRGMTRVHEASAAQGIEDDAGGDPMGVDLTPKSSILPGINLE